MPLQWSEEMLAILRANAGKMKAKDIGKLVGRGETATRIKIQRLGLKPFVQGYTSLWTPEQVEILRKADPRAGVHVFQKLFGYGETSIRKKARQLGIKFIASAGWTPEQIDRVKNAPPSLTARELAKEIGKSLAAVHHKRHKLGITGVPGSRRPKSEPARKVHATPIQIIRVTERTIDYCPQCHAPVSNWSQHYERMGHIEPRLQAWYEQQAAKRSA